MTKTFEEGLEQIARLCSYYATNRESFLAEQTKEAHIRQTLIDPFFEELGWDVKNTALAAPQYRDVVAEDRLDVEGQTRAPDYAFRVGPSTRFFVEAKKSSIRIDVDSGPALQLRRYGWSASASVSKLALRQVRNASREIDEMVYKLYKLSDAEITVVERYAPDPANSLASRDD